MRRFIVGALFCFLPIAAMIGVLVFNILENEDVYEI